MPIYMQLTIRRQLIRAFGSRKVISGVAMLLACMLWTHWLLCLFNSNVLTCQDTPARGSSHPAVSMHMSHGPACQSAALPTSYGDICCKGIDELRILTAFIVFAAPRVLVTSVVWAALLSMLAPLVPIAAAIYGRDGPTSVPLLRSLLIRACLPHRAPPVYLA